MRKNIGILGGLFLTISPLFPYLFESFIFPQGRSTIIIWMFGLRYIEGSFLGKGYSHWEFCIEPITFICMVALILLGILIVLNARDEKGSQARILGLLAVFVMIAILILRYLYVLILLSSFILRPINAAYTLVPFIGFFVGLAGSIMAIIGKN